MKPHFEQVNELGERTGKPVYIHETDTDIPSHKELGANTAHGAHKAIKKLVEEERTSYIEVEDVFGKPCETHPNSYDITSEIENS